MTNTRAAETDTKPQALPAGAIVHPSCGQWWTGLSRAHCAAAGCHRTFSTDSAADKHRVGKFDDGTRRCADPATVGLVARPKLHGDLWGWPAPEGGYAFHDAAADAQ